MICSALKSLTRGSSERPWKRKEEEKQEGQPRAVQGKERGDVEAAREELGERAGLNERGEEGRSLPPPRRKRQRRVGERIAGRGRNRPQSSSGEKCRRYVHRLDSAAQAWGRFVKVVSALLQAEGIDVNRAKKDGSTPLYIACQEGHLDVVRMLLSTEGIEPDRARKDGMTPLFIACQEGHLDVVRMLLSVDGIDPNRANAKKQTPVNTPRTRAPRGRPPPADAPGTGHHHGDAGQHAGGLGPQTGPHGRRVSPPRARCRIAR